MVSLRGMTEKEFLAFFELTVSSYAADKVKSGQWTSREALERSRKELTALLPADLASPNQHLYTIESGAEPAGHLWFSFDPRTTGDTGFIYELFVAEPFRRRGVATEALRLLEVEAARLGVSSLALHVFGFNQAARALYQKLGYETTNIRMAKELAPAPIQESEAQ